jgi:hypothetical protein
VPLSKAQECANRIGGKEGVGHARALAGAVAGALRVLARGALVAVKALTDAGGSVAGTRGALDVVAVVVLPVF